MTQLPLLSLVALAFGREQGEGEGEGLGEMVALGEGLDEALGDGLEEAVGEGLGEVELVEELSQPSLSLPLLLDQPEKQLEM